MLSRSRLVLAGLTAATVVAGCGDLDQASAASITRDDLVSEMAGQLAGTSALTYTATYRMVGGDSATVTQAQKPTRIAYAYAGGRVIVTPGATFRCAGASCTETTPSPAADRRLTGTSMLTSDAVLDMLNTAALDEDVIAEQHDTTIAGRHATCLDLSQVDGTPAREFSVCVTNEGALGSFTATIHGERVDLALTEYADKAGDAAFLLPFGAKLVDKRIK